LVGAASKLLFVHGKIIRGASCPKPITGESLSSLSAFVSVATRREENGRTNDHLAFSRFMHGHPFLRAPIPLLEGRVPVGGVQRRQEIFYSTRTVAGMAARESQALQLRSTK